MIHGSVKVVEVLVAEERVVGQIELAARVLVRVVVASAREVEPFRMPELAVGRNTISEVPRRASKVRRGDSLALKVEVAFSTESVGDETVRSASGELSRT